MQSLLLSKKQLAAQAGISTRTLRRYILKLQMGDEIPGSMRLVPQALATKLLNLMAACG